MINIEDNFAHKSNYWHHRIKHNVAICYHTIEGTATSALHTSQNPKDNVSYDYIVSKDKIIRNVPEGAVAWTQGVKQEHLDVVPDWYDEELYDDYNGCFIGIEVEGWHDQRLDDKTYWNLVKLVGYLCEKYEIPLDMEYHYRHSDLSIVKKDPGIAYSPDDVIADVLEGLHRKPTDDDRISRLEARVGWLTSVIENIGDAANGSHV